MKVKDLLALLSKMPPEADVVAKGYEGGVDDIVSVQLVKLSRDVHDEMNGITAGMRSMKMVTFRQFLFRGRNVNL